LKVMPPRASLSEHADVAQLVEHHLAKVGVAGSNPVVRSKTAAGGSVNRDPAVSSADSMGLPWITLGTKEAISSGSSSLCPSDRWWAPVEHIS
jgi:hypothetical protein